MRPSRPRCSLLVGLPLLVGSLAACDDLQDFETTEGQVFRGAVVGSPPQRLPDGGMQEPFLLHGFPANVQMELTLDPQAAARGSEDIGTLVTYVCEEPLRVDCPESMRSEGPIQAAQLAAVPGLADDALSRYTFPGPSRIRNFLLSVPFESEGVVRAAMVFVSLMENDGIEVRVVAPGVATEGSAGEGGQLEPLFGFFRLERAAK